MKKHLVVAFVAAITFALLEWPSLVSAVGTLPRPRFEVIYNQSFENGELGGYSSILSVIHDKESGQEVVCATGVFHDTRSCWATGRNWK